MSTDQTIERTTLSELVSNEQYARKVLPFIKSEYFADRTERILFEEIQKFVEKYNALPTKSTLEIEIDTRTHNSTDPANREIWCFTKFIISTGFGQAQ